MNDTPTPETEALAGRIDPKTLEHDAYATMTMHAIKLERERDAALDELRNIANATPAEWGMTRAEFAEQFIPWAQNRARYVVRNLRPKTYEASEYRWFKDELWNLKWRVSPEGSIYVNALRKSHDWVLTCHTLEELMKDKTVVETPTEP